MKALVEDSRAPAPRAPPARRRDRASCDPGMPFGHDLLIALILAVALGATILLYR